MTGTELSANLGLRMEDPAESVFTESAKVDAINMGQKSVVNMIDNNYLAELQTVSEAVSVTANKVSYEDLSISPIRNGIVRVRATTEDLWCTMLEVGDAKRLENSYLSGSTSNPVAYVFKQIIYAYGPTNIEVWYLKAPTDYAAGALSAECELNPALQELVLDFAEAQLWRMDAKPDRANSAYSNALNVIKVLNERYQIEKPEGIGTKGR